VNQCLALVNYFLIKKASQAPKRNHTISQASGSRQPNGTKTDRQEEAIIVIALNLLINGFLAHREGEGA